MIGIFGGTFDPVHYGHLKPAHAVMEGLGLDRVLFIPNKLPPHRDPPWLNAEQRLELLQTAIQSYEGFELDTRELQRSGPSYMVDTLRSLKEDYPDERFCLIMGIDAFINFESWYQWQRILMLCHLVVTQRPGYDFESITISDVLRSHITGNKAQLYEQEAGRILLQSVPQLAISSTEIRQHLRNQRIMENWLPKDVYKQLERFLPDE